MYTDKLLLKMLSEDTQQKIINEFKSLSVNTELSYETWVHKKVYDAKYVSAIPEGKRYMRGLPHMKNKMSVF